jgi:uncharacterized protein YfiM (DUF2279 family)
LGKRKNSHSSVFGSLLSILLIFLLIPAFCFSQNNDSINVSSLINQQSNQAIDSSELFLKLSVNSIPSQEGQQNFFIHKPQKGVGFSPTNILFNYKLDTLTPQQKKKRTWLIGSANVVGYGGVMTALASAWYDNYTKTKLHSFNDSKEWQQVDKAGHYYGTWIESRANNELWKWTGMERKKRIWISGLTSFAFQTTIEYLDGKSAEWGWSWADFGANVLGSSTFIAQELAWDEQRIKLKWSFHKKTYKDASLNKRSDELFGKSSPERFLKDYNGQTYWASINLKSFFPKSKLPDWLGVSAGYGAEGMFGGTENIAKDANGNITFDRRDIKRYRQWFLAPDIDLSKIKTKSKAVHFMLMVFSAFKFPTPSLEFSNGKLKAHAIHF